MMVPADSSSLFCFRKWVFLGCLNMRKQPRKSNAYWKVAVLNKSARLLLIVCPIFQMISFKVVSNITTCFITAIFHKVLFLSVRCDCLIFNFAITTCFFRLLFFS
ncbi:hypothetical protein NECAME_15969 [Necator americanus]|uniref:Uncharacterized protein n=1 Tax=Necator americanus TaxID=51031 RepID=W2SF86_NECAM|nr:hypothetical protein NECAME_15969 [Necator americanus]ETN68188.1 hypothetical protein NECAME_15969 [Necator americanus]